ncbi:hypothetical protein GCM10023091_04290 [Ravibacter arvi]|uniref:Uncharacterized protein n=1 Tax=Ravibacter arvi TaxID=2051041 RepID=A0ABP8LNH9_9BACT
MRIFRIPWKHQTALLQAGAIFLLILSAPGSYAQTTRWTPTFDQFKIVPNYNFPDHHIRTLRDYLFFGFSRISKESGIVYFRVNGKGQVDSIRIDGFFKPEIQNWLRNNIESTNGKWTLPQGTKESDFCWFTAFFSNRKIPVRTTLSIFYPVGNFSVAIKKLHQALLNQSEYFEAEQRRLNHRQHLVHTDAGVIVNPLVYPEEMSYK